jgi:hypothetical protein
MHRRLARATVVAAFLALSAPAAAMAAAPATSIRLPGDASAAGVRADRSTWIVGARPGAASARVAGAHGAQPVGPLDTGSYLVARGRARALAAALQRRGLLIFAGPNALRRSAAMPVDPLDSNPWRNQIVDPALTPPAVSPTSPLIALADAALDPTHPEFVGGNTSTLGGMPVTEAHGTATASVAAAPANGVGLSGVWPGARALNVPVGPPITCANSEKGILNAVKAKATVINMSYGSSDFCENEYRAILLAFGAGIVPVAAAGNEFAEGNPVEFPASLPHVLTVGSVGPDDKPSFFSSANVAVDVAAPGEHIPTAVPPALDGDGTQDGWQAQSGTSFAAPMVSAALAWVSAARPDLLADQLGDVIRYSSRDVAGKGYDSSTGYGVISVGAALAEEAGPHDPGEPNDDMEWIDGRMFGKADPAIYRGSGTVRLGATVDATEDPTDVYRVKVRGRRSIHVTADPSYGRITLLAYAPAARSLSDKRRRIGRSARPGGRTERLTIANGSRRVRTFYVAVEVADGNRLDAGYLLRVGR